MQDELVQQIAAHPDYVRLVRTRSRFGWWLSILMLFVYYGFITLVAFNKSLLAQRLGEGVTTLGIPIGLGVIFVTVLITVVYIRRANREFDVLTDNIKKAVSK